MHIHYTEHHCFIETTKIRRSIKLLLYRLRRSVFPSEAHSLRRLSPNALLHFISRFSNVVILNDQEIRINEAV